MISPSSSNPSRFERPILFLLLAGLVVLLGVREWSHWSTVAFLEDRLQRALVEPSPMACPPAAPSSAQVQQGQATVRGVAGRPVPAGRRAPLAGLAPEVLDDLVDQAIAERKEREFDAIEAQERETEGARLRGYLDHWRAQGLADEDAREVERLLFDFMNEELLLRRARHQGDLDYEAYVIDKVRMEEERNPALARFISWNRINDIRSGYTVEERMEARAESE